MKKMFSFMMPAVLLMTIFSGSSCIKTAAENTPAPAASDAAAFSMDDVQNMQDFLLAKTDAAESAEKQYDLSGDQKWSASDLTLMKRILLPETAAEPQSDTLVVYFSRTGNTEKIAKYLIELTDADSYVIEAAVPYTDEDIAYNNASCRANQEQNDKTVRPEIAAPLASLDGYETVFLGYPIWWGEEPRIIDTFLENYDFSEKTVIPFCTSGSSGISASEKNIAALVPIGEQLAGKRFAASASKDAVETWYASLPLEKEDTAMKMQITVGDRTLTATMENNSSVKALAELLKNGALTLDLHDYGSFEKVGNLPESLPRNDEQISVDAGDLILYQGNQFSIYYDENAWSFTKLGHIDNITKEELKTLLGDGNVTVTLTIQP